MAVQKVFWEDPYLAELEAEIKTVNGNVITVDKTIAYAFAGGQQSDFGTIGGYEISEARKEGNEIYYTITPEHSLHVGDIAAIKIDWGKRYRIMKLHFAAELILELVYQNFGHPEKIGANITFEKARVDFFWHGNISECFPFLNERLNEIISSNLEIESNYSDIENERRYWEIKGFARIDCGGTHIKSTGEIGSLSLKRVNIGGGKERIEIVLLD